MTKKITRQSNFELLRIIFMFLIVLHHYCTNSGFGGVIHNRLVDDLGITFNMILIQFASFGGKMGVNGFFILSGYFMIMGSMKMNKVYRLLSTVSFYNIVVFIFFSILGYRFSIYEMVRDIVPLIFVVPYSFIASYILIYLISDIVNKCLKYISQKEFLYLLAVLIFYFSILSTIFLENTFNYFGWGLTMYCVGAYIRLYPLPSILMNTKFLIFCILASLFYIWTFIVIVNFKGAAIDYNWEFMQSEGTRIPMLIMAVSFVLLFRNITVPPNRFINTVAASCLGVFLIHACNSFMIYWLWHLLFHNVKYFDSNYLWLHMIFAVVSVYVVCTLIDYLRIRYIENPIFNKIEQRQKEKLNNKVDH